jgi:hypothetical protein
MRKLLNKPWIAAILAVAAIACVAMAVFSNGQKFGLPGPASPDASASASEDGTAADPSHTTAWGVVNKISIPSSDRDPFAIKVKATEIVEKAPEPDLVDSIHLSAIWTQEGRTLVLINDRICQDGDEIGRLKIASATPDGVWLTHWKGRDFISIGGNFTLNTPADKFRRAASSL